MTGTFQVLSIFLMTVWYMLCYSLIIFNNFKNLVGNLNGEEIAIFNVRKPII